MAFKIKNGSDGFPKSGESVVVYYAGTTQRVTGLRTPDSNLEPLSNPFTITEDQEWWGFEPPSTEKVDVWWVEQRRYLVQNVMCCDITLLDNPYPQYLLIGSETDPIFNSWDKSEGISISKSQISDLGVYQEVLVTGTNIKTVNQESILGSGDLTVLPAHEDETDPIFTAWDKSEGISITKSQISDWIEPQLELVSGTNIKTINGQSIVGSGDIAIHPEETDPIFTVWNKRDGILITKSQIIDLKDYQEELVSGINIKTINGESILGSGELVLELNETDPIFTAWDKSTGITITESQISDFGNYQEQLVSGDNIKTINDTSILGEGDLIIDSSDYVETDPIFAAWDKSTGITITESQITDFGNYQEELVSGVNIKTINGQSVLGSGDIFIDTETLNETDPIFTAWNKRDGITVTESQITNFGNYQEELISGVNIKTINGESVLGSGDITIPTDVVSGAEVVSLVDESLGGEHWKYDSNEYGVSGIGDIIQTFASIDSTWLPCNHSEYLIEDYPRLAPMMEVASYEANGTPLATVWGDNYKHSLGTGFSTTDVTSPVYLNSDENWVEIACARHYNGGLTAALKTDGSLWVWGDYVAEYSSYTPVQFGSDYDWSNQFHCNYADLSAIKTDGSLWVLTVNGIEQVGTSYDFWKIDYERVIKTDGTLWSFDVGDTLALTQIGTDTDWVEVSHYDHDLAIKDDGTLWAWGDNQYGQLGLGDTIDRSVPTQVGIDSDWKEIQTGLNSGYAHSLALKTDGTIWAWGSNYFGRLGLGDTIDRSVPTQVGTDSDWKTVKGSSNFVMAIKTDGSLWTWGGNYTVFGVTGNYLEPINFEEVLGIGELESDGSNVVWDKIATGHAYVLGLVEKKLPVSFYTPTILEPNGIEDGTETRNTYYIKAK